MTSSHGQGSTATLVVLWREFPPDGPLVDVNNVQITITPLSGGGAVVGPTAIGVTHPAVGTNVYDWAVPLLQTPGDYLVGWSATDPGTGGVLQASEIITVTAVATGTLPTGLCAPWDPIWCCALTAESAATSGYAVASATEALWNATRQQFGLCEETLRPCRRTCFSAWPFAENWWEWTGGMWPRPLLFDGAWFNITCGSCAGGCSCTVLEETLLPAPVYDIVQVKVDGIPLDASAYRLDDGRILTRVDGGTWPVCQDLALADTEVGTWSVTARFGRPVTILGRQAVGELACEIIRACAGEDCRLPKNIATLARQGVTISLPDNGDVLENLYFTRLFLNAYNPKRLTGLAAVYDVDGPTFRRAGT